MIGRKILLTILLWCSGSYAFAQAGGYNVGYIVTLKGDTLHGLVKNVNIFPYMILTDVKFKATDKAKVETYEPTDLKAYQLEGDIYESKIYRSKALFVRRMAAGNLSLYEKKTLVYNNTGIGGMVSTRTDYYLQRKSEGELTMASGRGFKKKMNAYFQDAPEISKKIEAGSYRKKDLSEIVMDYNSRPITEFHAVILQSGISRLPLSFKAGLNLDNTSYRNSPDGFADVNQNSIGMHVGMSLKIKLGRGISLTPELQYIQKQSNLKSIETPIILSYSVNKFLDIEAGPQGGYVMKPRGIRFGGFEKDYFFLDYGLNGGVRFHISKRMALVCRYYYGLQDIINLYDDIGSKYPTLGYNRNLQVSLYFKPGKEK